MEGKFFLVKNSLVLMKIWDTKNSDSTNIAY